jgi:3-hydroxyisobutyrate dehydrogenase-like beta-hydroxyacid dehydrogenase
LSTRYGFIGLGDMGGGIAENVARAGLDLTASDLRPAMADEVRGWGATWSPTSGELVAEVDVLLLCLVDDAQVLGFLRGPEGLARMCPGSGLVVFSTVEPATMTTIVEEAGARDVWVVDAPVSGGRAAALAGTLAVMIGGDTARVEQLRPVWDAVGGNVFHIAEEVGSGQVAKLCNNLMGLVNNLATFECMRLGAAYGVPEQVLVDVARVSSGNSWYIENWGFSDGLIRTHPHGGADEGYRILLKDLQSAVAVARARGVELAVAGHAAEVGRDVLAERDRTHHQGA